MNRIYACPVADVPEVRLSGSIPRPSSPCSTLAASFMPLTIVAAMVMRQCQKGIWKMTPRWSARYTPPVLPENGKALCLPATDPLTTYPVHVEGGDIFIDLPEAQP